MIFSCIDAKTSPNNFEGKTKIYKTVRKFSLSQSSKSQRKLLSSTLSSWPGFHRQKHFCSCKVCLQIQTEVLGSITVAGQKTRVSVISKFVKFRKNSSVVAGLEFYSLGKECHWSGQTHKLKMFRSFGGREHGVMVEVNNSKSLEQCLVPKTLMHFYSFKWASSCLSFSMHIMDNYENILLLKVLA